MLSFPLHFTEFDAENSTVTRDNGVSVMWLLIPGKSAYHNNPLSVHTTWKDQISLERLNYLTCERASLGTECWRCIQFLLTGRCLTNWLLRVKVMFSLLHLLQLISVKLSAFTSVML